MSATHIRRNNGGNNKKTNSQKSKKFWDKEYKRGGKPTRKGFTNHRDKKAAPNLALSTNPSEDFLKFTRWLERSTGRAYLRPVASALDIGCGNGRNLFSLSKEFGCQGVGFDISHEAIIQAKKRNEKEKLPLEFSVRDMKEALPLPDASQTFVLDMMASHFLNNAERKNLLAEIVRVLRPDGWLFFKTFLLDEDLHAARLLRDHSSGEEGTYIHPEVGVPEHVFTEEEIDALLSPNFIIHKMLRSHRHIKNGRAWKRRSISVYAQKIN